MIASVCIAYVGFDIHASDASISMQQDPIEKARHDCMRWRSYIPTRAEHNVIGSHEKSHPGAYVPSYDPLTDNIMPEMSLNAHRWASIYDNADDTLRHYKHTDTNDKQRYAEYIISKTARDALLFIATYPYVTREQVIDIYQHRGVCHTRNVRCSREEIEKDAFYVIAALRSVLREHVQAYQKQRNECINECASRRAIHTAQQEYDNVIKQNIDIDNMLHQYVTHSQKHADITKHMPTPNHVITMVLHQAYPKYRDELKRMVQQTPCVRALQNSPSYGR